MRISRKLELLVTGLVAAVIVTGLAGFLGVMSVRSDITYVDESARETLAVARISRTVISIGKAQLTLMTDLDEETLSDARENISNERENYARRYERALSTANAAQRKALNAFDAEFTAFNEQVDQTFVLARTMLDAPTPANEQALQTAVRRSLASEIELEDAARTFTQDATRRGEARVTDAKQASLITVIVIAVLSTVAIAGGIVASILIARRGIVQPLNNSIGVLRSLADEKVDIEITGAEAQDEIGDIARAMERFRDGIIERRRLEAEAEEKDRLVEEERKRSMAELSDQIEQRIGRISRVVSEASAELQAAAQQTASAVEETSAQSAAVAAAAEQASVNVQTVASATEELSTAIADVSKQVSDASRTANDTSDIAENVSKEVEKLNEAMAMVDSVIEDIEGVADQTNLLALNATIEAARAGEAGKGFGVVAQEVKGLAQKTQQMTDEVGSKIDTVRTQTESVVKAIATMIGKISEIDHAATAIAAAVEQQSAATGEISRNAAEASTGTQEVTSNIAGVQSASTQTSAATGTVRDHADKLQSEARALTEAIEETVKELRTA